MVAFTEERMAMGKRKKHEQQPLFIVTTDLPQTPAHPFYAKLNEVLAAEGFDPFVQGLCAKFYHQTMGRPSLEPGKYFRLLLLGYFEGIDSERGIAWRCADSLSLRSFVGYALDEAAVDHSTISRTRRLVDLETHQEVFAWVLKVLAKQGLIDGKTVGVDSTTLEANAAMRSIVRRDTRESYEEFLTRLAKASGIETPTREDLARIDKSRKNKASNKDWEHPYDPDARIAKMKDGSTHLAHKAEHAVDMQTGALLAVTLQGADQGDTTTLRETIAQTTQNLQELSEDRQTREALHEDWMGEVVADKGYHSNETMSDLVEMDVRTYISEPKRGRRNWQDQAKAKAAVYANRRRTRGARGQRLMRRRGELIERSFAHVYETGGMRRLHLKHRENIAKRLLVHAGGFNLGLVMRQLTGVGKPRRLQGLFTSIIALVLRLWNALAKLRHQLWPSDHQIEDSAPFRLAA
jgi:transposase